MKPDSTNATILLINSMSVSLEYANYSDVFEEKEILQLSSYCFSINYEITLASDSNPFYSSIYNLSESELHYFKEYINQMLVRGFIYPSNFPFSLLILFIKKANESLCFIANYHTLNKMTVQNLYLLPLI